MNNQGKEHLIKLFAAFLKSSFNENVELLKGTVEVFKNGIRDELEFYTVKATGECGMSQSTLAKLAGTDQTNLSKLENTLQTKAPSHYLEPWVKQDFTINGQNVNNLTLYKADYCAAVIAHYAIKGNKTALHYLGTIAQVGFKEVITGYNKKITN